MEKSGLGATQKNLNLEINLEKAGEKMFWIFPCSMTDVKRHLKCLSTTNIRIFVYSILRSVET